VFSKVRARFGGRLKFSISGAAALPREVAEFIDALGIAVYEGYGLTETSPVASANTPSYRKLGSVGRPVPGVRVEIDMCKGHDSQCGEIIIHGPNVMKGYHERAEENRRVFTADGGLRTGDLGYLDADGYLFITGRIKEQYKLTNAKYVVPGPLEDELKLSPFIENVMIYGDNRPHNVALIVPDPTTLISWAESEDMGELRFEELLGEPRIRALIQAEIERLSGSFKSYERVEDFALLPEDFTQENGMATPSLKLKRREIVHRYNAVLTEFYTCAQASAAPSREKVLAL
jgi:long-chain acyl-CoA synthetase